MSWFNKFRKASTEPKPGTEGIMESPFMNFTPRAQHVLALARKEADRFNHNFLGTEHLLLGLIKLGQGVAVNVLAKLGLDLESVRKEVERQVGKGPGLQTIGNTPYTPRVKKVLGLAAKEAKALNHIYVGTEHILLGLLREGGGVAGKVLEQLEVNLEEARREILRELDPNFSSHPDGDTPNLPSKETTSMPSRFEMPQNPELGKPKQDSIDTSKRYVVYCTERIQEIMVYRNALLKGIKKLYQARQYDFMSEFMELEQVDGQTIFLSRSSIIMFCEHGVTPSAETISNKKLPG
jgi:hypothetical protein